VCSRSRSIFSINAILPGIVHTKIIPPEMIAAIPQGYLTTVSASFAAYDRFLENETRMAGEDLECLVGNNYFPKCLTMSMAPHRGEHQLSGIRYDPSRAVRALRFNFLDQKAAVAAEFPDTREERQKSHI
jgi:hypothetical protein